MPGILSVRHAGRFRVLASFWRRSGGRARLLERVVQEYAQRRCSPKPRQNAELARRASLKVLAMGASLAASPHRTEFRVAMQSSNFSSQAQCWRETKARAKPASATRSTKISSMGWQASRTVTPKAVTPRDAARDHQKQMLGGSKLAVPRCPSDPRRVAQEIALRRPARRGTCRCPRRSPPAPLRARPP